MQITPPSVKPTVKSTEPSSGRVSRRRLISLLVTAAVASFSGIALGSSLRFKMGPVSQAPLFKPQQDFPPLAEWPPKVPLGLERDELDTYWEEAPPSPQLVYDTPYDEDIEIIENSDGNSGFYTTDDYALEEDLTLEESSSPTPATVSVGNDTLPEEVFEEETSPSVISTNTDELDNDPDSLESSDMSAPVSAGDPPPWFDKQPLSESKFTDGPVIVSPDALDPLSDFGSD